MRVATSNEAPHDRGDTVQVGPVPIFPRYKPGWKGMDWHMVPFGGKLFLREVGSVLRPGLTKINVNLQEYTTRPFRSLDMPMLPACVAVNQRRFKTISWIYILRTKGLGRVQVPLAHAVTRTIPLSRNQTTDRFFFFKLTNYPAIALPQLREARTVSVGVMLRRCSKGGP